MNPGVGSACSVNRPTNPIAEAGKRGFKFSLDRPDARSLDLEPGIVRAVVFDPRPEPSVGSAREGALSGTWG
jgi:hypothetical protein